jgi:hypothetical protein
LIEFATATGWLIPLPLQEHLRPIASRAAPKDADVGEGGMMLGGTGIAEVRLTGCLFDVVMI